MTTVSPDAYSDIFHWLRRREGLTVERVRDLASESGDRLEVLLTSPAVQDRIDTVGEPGPEALVACVRLLAGELDPTTQLVLDASLRLGLTLDEGQSGYDELYGAELQTRRSYLLKSWVQLHRLRNARNAPRRPSGTLLRTTLEDRAFTELAGKLVVGTARGQSILGPLRRREPFVGRAVVFGGAVTDTLMRIAEPLQSGRHTTQARSFHEQPGGKGLTQAVALARQGFSVDLVTTIGDDEAGDEIVRRLDIEGVGTNYLQRVPGTTPRVVIVTDDSTGLSTAIGWKNTDEISLSFQQADQILADLDPGEFLFITLDIEFDGLKETLRSFPSARAERPTIFMTPAPASHQPLAELAAFSSLDFLIGETSELRALLPGGRGLSGTDAVAELEDEFGVGTVILYDEDAGTVSLRSDADTPKGATRGGSRRESAGGREALVAGLAAQLAKREQDDWSQLSNSDLEFGRAALAVASLQPGVTVAMPTSTEVEAYIERNKGDASRD